MAGDRPSNVGWRKPLALLMIAWTTPCMAGFGPRMDVQLYPSANVLRILLADVDVDGNLDLVVTSIVPGGQSPGAMVWLGDGTGRFSVRAELPVPEHATSLAVARFDADQWPDIVVLTRYSPVFGGGWLEVFHGNGDGTFGHVGTTYIATAGRPHRLRMADLNDDGEEDLVVIGDELAAFLGDGQGGFSPAQSIDHSGVMGDCAIWDIDGDGDQDLACNEGVCDACPDIHMNVVVRLGNGDGTFGLPAGTYTTGASTWGLAAADLNGDGFRDVVLADAGPFGGDRGSAVVMLGGPGATFGPPARYGSGIDPIEVAVADFDQDGARDVALSIEGEARVAVFRGRGDGTLETPTLLETALSPQHIAVGDINGDGWLDVAVGSFYEDVVSVFLNDGIATPVLASLVEAVAERDRVLLVWAGQVEGAVVERRTEGAAWVRLGTVTWDGQHARFEDRTVHPSMRYEYRLGIQTADGEVPGPSVWVHVPGRLSLVVRGATSGQGIVAVEVDLPTSADAMLETFDLQGRRIERIDLAPGNAGTRLVELDGRYSQGVYLARIRQGNERAGGRILIVR